MSKYHTPIPNYDLLAERSDLLREVMPGFSIPPKPSKKIGFQKRTDILETVHVTSDRIPSPLGFETINARVARHNAAIEAKALYQYHSTNKMPKILEGVPTTLSISDWDLLSSLHVVWYDKNTGVVQCVLDKNDKVGLKFWLRYFSDLPQFVKVTGSQFARIASASNGVVVHNGEVVRWGTSASILTYIANNQKWINATSAAGDTWEVYKRGAIFPELRWDRPSTTNLSRVAVVHALYSNHK